MSVSDVYTLYWEAMSGAIAPQAMFEEMGVAYRKVAVDMERGEHQSSEYLAINPTGQIPALKLPDGTVIGESAAMILLLGERHPNSRLVPVVGNTARPIFLHWLFFMAASVYMTFVRSNHSERFTTDRSAVEQVRLVALLDIERYFDILNDAIVGKPFFLSSGFSALDIYLTMLTAWHPDLDELFKRCPKVGALSQAVEGRASYSRVITEHRTA